MKAIQGSVVSNNFSWQTYLIVRLHHPLTSREEDEFLESVRSRLGRLTLGMSCSFSSMVLNRLLSSTCCSYCDFSGSLSFPLLPFRTWNGRRRIADANLSSVQATRLHSHVRIQRNSPLTSYVLDGGYVQNEQRPPKCAVLFPELLGQSDIQSMVDNHLKSAWFQSEDVPIEAFPSLLGACELGDCRDAGHNGQIPRKRSLRTLSISPDPSPHVDPIASLAKRLDRSICCISRIRQYCDPPAAVYPFHDHDPIALRTSFRFAKYSWDVHVVAELRSLGQELCTATRIVGFILE